VVAALVYVAASVIATSASADIIVHDKDGWKVTFDGRANGFYSYQTGDVKPTGGTPGMGGIVGVPFQAAPDENGTSFTVSRVHGGYVGSIFGFKVQKQITENLLATGRMAIWWPIETDQFRGYSSMVPDPRESYVKLEGPWGGLLAGRTLGLHDRGGTQIDFLYANGYSIGSPCNAIQQGPLCGHIGYGYQFPGFNSGIVYNTPAVAGLQLSVGIYDPARVGFGTPELTRLPAPRVESELNYDLTTSALKLAVFVNGMWQRAGGDVAGVAKTVDAMGVSYGGRVELGGFKIGAAGNLDKGGGELSGLVDRVPIDQAGELRLVAGWLVQAMFSPGPLDFAAGAGATVIRETVDDVIRENSVIQQRLGLNATINYHLGPVVFNAQYFRAKHTYWRGEQQTMNYLHTGMTFVW